MEMPGMQRRPQCSSKLLSGVQNDNSPINKFFIRILFIFLPWKMKIYFTLFVLLFFCTLTQAQVPEKMSYQAVIRNADNKLVANKEISIRMSILQGTVDGTAVFIETHRTRTNGNGLIGIEIGSGYAEAGVFADIYWPNGPYFIKTEADLNGGTNYSLVGINQLLSVPYAHFAKTAQTAQKLEQAYPETDPDFHSWDKSTGIRISKDQINNFGDYLENESDPLFTSSVAHKISASDTAKWNNKLDRYTESDPVFQSSVAKGITAADTAAWNHKPDRFTETQTLADVLANSNAANGPIKNLADPTDAQDAATKAYVDALFRALENGGIHLVDFSANVQELTLDLIVHFMDNSLIHADSWLWDFGDGNTSTEQNPIHEYETEGNYTISLSVSVGTITRSKSKNLFFAPQAVGDSDGNIYPTISIGNQIWFAENLKTTRLNDGTPISNPEDQDEWINTVDPAYCWMMNDLSFKEEYGALYNGYAVQTNKLCPVGWHVPSTDEWDELLEHAGGSYSAGCKLKETGTEHWAVTHSCVTNEFGFSLLPGGQRLQFDFTRNFYDQPSNFGRQQATVPTF